MTLNGHERSVNSVTFSADGKKIISGSSDHTIRIWNAQTGAAVGEPLRGHSERVTDVAISQDGKWIASAANDYTVRTWSMSTFSENHVFKGHSDWVTCVAFSPNGDYLISGSLDSTIRFWNVHTGEAVGLPLTGHTSWVYSVAFSPDGQEIVSGSWDETIRVWDARARTDSELFKKVDIDHSKPGEEEFSFRWNECRAHTNFEDDGWVRDEGRLLLWVPLQYRHDIKGGTRLVIGAQGTHWVRPEVDHQKLFRYSGARWKNVFTADRYG